MCEVRFAINLVSTLETYTKSRRLILQKHKKSVFILTWFFWHLCYKSIFSELGQMLHHPTHDSAKSSPNGRLSCPTQCFFLVVRSLPFLHHAQTLDQSLHRVIFCSPESTPDAGIFFFGWSPKLTKQQFLFFISFCTQLTPQAITVSHFLTLVDLSSHALFSIVIFGAPSPPGHPSPVSGILQPARQLLPAHFTSSEKTTEQQARQERTSTHELDVQNPVL